MRLSRRVIALVAAVTVTGAASSAAFTTAASAAARSTSTAKPAVAAHPLGTKSLASVLLADKSGFDHNGKDFDILRAAVLAVLKAKPNSPVKVLTDGNTALTAFLPTDQAFELLVQDITKSKHLPTEKAAFAAVAGLGINTVETVLLYHVVPGATVDAKTALKADGTALKTAQGGTIKLHVGLHYPSVTFTLVDADTNDRDPNVIKVDIDKGNKQIAHVIDRVLRPVDLP